MKKLLFAAIVLTGCQNVKKEKLFIIESKLDSINREASLVYSYRSGIIKGFRMAHREGKGDWNIISDKLDSTSTIIDSMQLTIDSLFQEKYKLKEN